MSPETTDFIFNNLGSLFLAFVFLYVLWRVFRWYFRLKRMSQGLLVRPTGGKAGRATYDLYLSHRQLLVNHWADVIEKGRDADVPLWYFDDVSERQLVRLEKIGLDTRNQEFNKGQASDVIGLFCKVDNQDKDVLKFFNYKIRDYNETTGRLKVLEILADSEKRALWQNKNKENNN